MPGVKGTMTVTESYALDQNTLPTLPSLHDCTITGMALEEEWITLRFEEEDPGRHDAIRCDRPQAKAVTVRYHLLPPREYTFARWHRGIHWLQPGGHYREIEKPDPGKLVSTGLEYLYCHVAHCSVIISLYSRKYREVYLSPAADPLRRAQT